MLSRGVGAWGGYTQVSTLYTKPACTDDGIVIPYADLGEDIGNLRQWVVELAHEVHVGGPAAKRLLRQRLWFSGMD